MFFNRPTPSRRQILGGIGVGASLLAVRGTLATDDTTGFTHGVASGDPLSDRVILWTRFRPNGDGARNITVIWEVASDEGFETIVSRGETKTGPKKDYTVKADASGLAPAQHYFYRFRAGDMTSSTGRTKTLPQTGAKEATLGVISCSNYPQGFFNVYKELAGRDVDAVVHLGDYIYEYADGVYSNDAAVAKGRAIRPRHEIVSLDDYRTRYALYRSDNDLQAAHAAHPFICVWDDHEIANDTWKDGAENHNEDEGPFEARKKAAVQAYHEWMPIRENAEDAIKINRTFDIGGLARLIMLDTRLIGRDKQLSYDSDLPMRSIPFDFRNPQNPKAVLDPAGLQGISAQAIKKIPVPFNLTGERPVPMTDFAEIQKLDPKNLPAGYSYLPDTETFSEQILGDENRTIMGAEQEAWLETELEDAKAANVPWQILGQQLLIGKVGIPQLSNDDIDFSRSKYISKVRLDGMRMLGRMGLPLNLDAWDGYPAARDRIFASIKRTGANAVFLAGDTHNAWCFDLTDKDGNPVSVEFGTPSVSSPGMEAYIPAPPQRVEEEVLKASPELNFFNSKDRGWMELIVRPETIQTNWYFVSTVLSHDYEVIEGPSIATDAGSNVTRRL